jgi:ribosomal protein S18 acetylase RimI-like enzyme
MEIVSLAFRTDVLLRALEGGQITDHDDHLVVRTTANPGFHWGNFLLVARTARRDAQAWRAVFAGAFPDAQYIAIGLDAASVAELDLTSYVAAGLTPEVSTVLTASALNPPAAPLPHTELRRLEGDDDWGEALALRRALYEDASEKEFVERSIGAARRLSDGGHGGWFGAFIDGQLRAGVGIFTDGRGLARYQNVETHPSYRRRGLGSWLVHHAGQYGLTELGARTLVIVADPGYHAIAVYRRLGFADREEQVQLTGRRQ